MQASTQATNPQSKEMEAILEASAKASIAAAASVAEKQVEAMIPNIAQEIADNQKKAVDKALKEFAENLEKKTQEQLKEFLASNQGPAQPESNTDKYLRRAMYTTAILTLVTSATIAVMTYMSGSDSTSNEEMNGA